MRKKLTVKHILAAVMLLVWAFTFYMTVCGLFEAPLSLALAADDAGMTTDASSLLDELDISALENYFNSLTESQKAFFGGGLADFLKSIVEGNFEFGFGSFASYILSVLGLSAQSVMPMLLSIIAITIAVSLIGGMRSSFSSSSVDGIVNFAGIALIAITVLAGVLSAVKESSELITALKTQMEAVFPIIFTLMTATGASASVAVYQPAVAILSVSITELVTAVAFPALIITIVFSVIGNLSSSVKLGGMAKFFTSASKWVLYTTFFLFIGFLSLQGITAAVYDNITVRTAKFALSKYVPVIGGYLSEGFNIILAGSVLIKNAVGLTFVIMLLLSVVPVLLKIVIMSLALKLAAAVTEPFANEKICGMLSSLSSSVGLLASIILGIAFLYFIFVILLISSGNLVL